MRAQVALNPDREWKKENQWVAIDPGVWCSVTMVVMTCKIGIV